jgi:uncharacterized damage-inducible protein DinB
MTSMDLIRDLYRHMEWADATTWSVVLESKAAAGDENLVERLRHVHVNQRAFLDIWREKDIDVHAADGLAPSALAAWARENHRALAGFLEALSDAALPEPLTLPWTKNAAEHLGHEPPPTSLQDTLLQVYGHAMHHRGQVAARLRELEADPPLVDYIAWIWYGRPAMAWP